VTLIAGYQKPIEIRDIFIRRRGDRIVADPPSHTIPPRTTPQISTPATTNPTATMTPAINATASVANSTVDEKVAPSTSDAATTANGSGRDEKVARSTSNDAPIGNGSGRAETGPDPKTTPAKNEGKVNVAITLFIRTSLRTLAITVGVHDTILKVKQRVQLAEGRPVSRQRLVRVGADISTLYDDGTISGYNLHDCTSLRLLPNDGIAYS
jgi:hypothetical protein